MSIRVQWLPYGRPAAEGLRAAVDEAKAGEPLTPVTVVVPSNHVGVATRRLLASGTLGPVGGRGVGLAAVTFLTVYRLAELLGSGVLAGHARRPVSTPVLTAALRAALAGDPGVFAPVADHPATELALVGAYQELRDVSASGLDRLAGTGPRAADVVRLYRAARARLRSDWYDEEDLVNASVDALSSGTVSTAALGPVVVHLPQTLTRHGARLLRTLAESVAVTVVAATTGDPRADVEVVRSVRRLQDDGAPPGPPDDLDPMAVVDAQRTRILTTSDADEEVRAAVRAIVAAARDGVPLERVAILYANPEPYARLVHDQLEAAGIAHNGTAVEPVTARLAGRVLLGLLALPLAGFRREDVFAWLSGARLLHHGRSVPVTAWERLSRQAGVVAGRRDWDELLARVVDEATEEARLADADPERPDWQADRFRENAERARGLREFVVGMVDDLADAASRPRPWADRAAWAQRHLSDLLGPPTRRDGWPLVEQKAAERVQRALDRLATLDAVEGPVGLDVFARTLELELEADLGRVGRMGEGVLVGAVQMGVGLDLDLAVVLGLTEGTFPAPARDDSLLPDIERQVAGDELALRAERVERQHRQLLAALAGADRHLLCVARGDLRRSTERIPSRWVLDVAKALSGDRLSSEDLLTTSHPWLDHVASFDAGLRRMAFPASEQEYRLRALLARPRRARGRRRGELPATGDDILDAGIAMITARRSDRFTRFDGNLDGLAVPSPADRTTSATRLQAWAVCPFAYLLNSILGVDEVENPEDRLRITHLDRGSLVHEILEGFILDVLARPAATRPRPVDPWTPADRALLLRIAQDRFRHYEDHGLVGRAIFWRRDRHHLLADLDRFLTEDSEYRARHGTRPVAAELAFGMSRGSLATADMTLPDGRTVRFRGKADRLDLSEAGVAHVVDYKTGRSDPYKDLSEENPDDGGTKLQLPVYGLAARLHGGDPAAPVQADFWFTSSLGDFKRIGYPVSAEVLERTSETVARLVEGIELGVFPNVPVDTSSTPSRFVSCAYCDPDALGTIDLARGFERKWGDAALAPYVGFVADDEDVEVEAPARG